MVLVTALPTSVSMPTSPPPNLQHQVRSPQARGFDVDGRRAAEAHFDILTATNSPWTPARVTVAAWFSDSLPAQPRAAASRQAANATPAMQRANSTLQLRPEKVFSSVTGSSAWMVGVALLLPLLEPGERAARRDVAAARTAVAIDRLALETWHSRLRATRAVSRLLPARQAEALASHLGATHTAGRAGVRQRGADRASDRGGLLNAELEAQQTAAALSARAVQCVAAARALASAIGLPWSTLRGAELSWPQLGAPPSSSALPGPTVPRGVAKNLLELAALPATA
ncbi:MAG: hypothetical protein ABI379_11000 [Rhodanobacter sp.]